MIQSTSADVAIQEYFCDDCDQEMKPTGYVLTSHPPQYPHKCPAGHKANLPHSYPRLVVRKVGEKIWKSLG